MVGPPLGSSGRRDSSAGAALPITSPGCDSRSSTDGAAPPGARNHALNRCSFRLFQLVAGGELDRAIVVDRLIDASHRNGLVKDDGLRSVMATIRSGAGAGLKFPRSRSGAA